MLSETLAKMPVKYYQKTDRGIVEAEQTETSKLLTKRPNPFMTPTVFWNTVEMMNSCDADAPLTVSLNICCTGNPVIPSKLNDVLKFIKQYEEEINYKMETEEGQESGFYYKFNEKVLFRTDSKTQICFRSQTVHRLPLRPACQASSSPRWA